MTDNEKEIIIKAKKDFVQSFVDAIAPFSIEKCKSLLLNYDEHLAMGFLSYSAEEWQELQTKECQRFYDKWHDFLNTYDTEISIEKIEKSTIRGAGDECRLDEKTTLRFMDSIKIIFKEKIVLEDQVLIISIYINHMPLINNCFRLGNFNEVKFYTKTKYTENSISNALKEFGGNIRSISFKEALSIFELNKYGYLDRCSVSRVFVIDGDVHIKEDLDDWYQKLNKNNDTLMIIVNGNLRVDGIAPGKDDFNAHLLVLGDIHCDVLRSCDEMIYVTGNAYVKYVYDGNYNDGMCVIKGILYTPYLINSDHHSDVNPSEETIKICYHGGDGNFDYDLTEEEFEDAFIFEIYSGEEFDRESFYQTIKDGKSPFVEGFNLKRS